MIKFLDLHKQKNRISSRIDGAIKRVLNHGQFILGKEVLELEKKLKEFSNAKHCITCANGTDALVLALRALEIKENEIVFAPSFTYVSTVEAIKLINAKVCFVDVESDTFNICPLKLKDSIKYIKKLGLKAKAIIAVDLFGQPANYDELKEISRKEKLSLISDAAQSFGAKQKNRKVGGLCEITTTSFFPAKPLGCYGDGGAVFTESTLVANKIKSLRSHGQGKDKYDNVRIGMNSRLDSIQAAILIEKLKIFDHEINIRNKIAKFYKDNLSEKIVCPEVKKENISVWAQFTIRVKNRKKLKENLNQNGIPTAIYYRNPNHTQRPYKNELFIPNSMNNTIRLSRAVLSLPMHPYLNLNEQKKIVKTLNDFYEKK